METARGEPGEEYVFSEPSRKNEENMADGIRSLVNIFGLVRMRVALIYIILQMEVKYVLAICLLSPAFLLLPMWLTTSKNSPVELKKSARALADALPGAEFIPRGERSLSRLEILAARKGEKTLVVMMVCDDGENHCFSLRSRHLETGEDGAIRWAWSEQRLMVKKIKLNRAKIRSELGEDPYIYSALGEAKAFCSFLGLDNHPLAEFMDEPAELKLELVKPKSKSKGKLLETPALEIKFDKEILLEMQCEWVE